MLDIFGLAQDEGYATMGPYMRKYVVFAAAEHTEDFPLLPIFPLQLSSLIRYGWYLQFHGVRGGIHSIRNYLSAITEANSAAGHPDPRAAEPWTWRKFRLNVPKHLLVATQRRRSWLCECRTCRRWRWTRTTTRPMTSTI